MSVYRARRGICRELASLLWQRPDESAEGFREQITDVFERCVTFLAQAPPRTPRRRVRFAVMSLVAVCLNRIVFGDSTGLKMAVADAALERELSEMLLGYLDRGE